MRHSKPFLLSLLIATGCVFASPTADAQKRVRPQKAQTAKAMAKTRARATTTARVKPVAKPLAQRKTAAVDNHALRPYVGSQASFTAAPCTSRTKNFERHGQLASSQLG